MSMIFTILVCMTFANPASAKYNGCTAPSNGLTYYQSEEECKRRAEHNTMVDAQIADPKMEWKCFKKAANPWSPTN